MEKHLNLDKVVQSANVCDLMDEKDIEDVGRYAKDGYTNDINSRAIWDERSARAQKLALQVVEEKSFPWPNCSNVKFPLITVAALQYQARAYPALVNANDLVKCRVFGQDPDGSKSQRAQRISAHMSWQNLEQDTRWEEDHDKLTLVQAIAGSAFKKRLFDPTRGRQVSQLVLPQDFVINYWCKDLETAPRYTHRFYLTPNDIRQRELDGRYRHIELTTPDPSQQDTDELKIAKDQRQGLYEPEVDPATPFFTGEQYCWMDLDGDDYEEPYIVTFDIQTGKVRRIVARFLPSGIKKRDEKIYEITPVKVFTKYGFIPSPDGGFYDLGLGAILGPINETVNSVINQMLDAGTMATLGGGFLGRGFKSKAGPFTFQPNQWFPVDAPGDDLRKNVLPLPVREPAQILFQLLGLLINYGEKIVSSTDLQMGENIGQNTPAETTRTLNENGSRVYNAIYKRTWRAMRDEFRCQYELNALFLENDGDYRLLSSGQTPMISAEDYRQPGLEVRPAADPHIVSDGERVKQATLVLTNAMQMPGHNRYQALLRYYKSLQVPNIDEFMPPPQTQGPDGKPQPAADFPPPPNPKMLEIQVKQADQQLRQQQFMAEQQRIQIELQQEVLESQANVAKLNAQATKLLAEAKGAEVEPQIKLLYAQIESEGKRQDKILKMVDTITKHMLTDQKQSFDMMKEISGGQGATGGAAMVGMAGAPANQGVPGNAQPKRPNGAGIMA